MGVGIGGRYQSTGNVRARTRAHVANSEMAAPRAKGTRKGYRRYRVRGVRRGVIVKWVGDIGVYYAITLEQLFSIFTGVFDNL